MTGICIIVGGKTKFTNPYDYDPILQFSARSKLPENGSCYSDRMSQWDYKKYRDLCEKHFKGKNGDPGGDYFDRRTPADIEAFLREYFDKPELTLLRVEEHCNVSNGFPVWFFAWNNPVAESTA